MGERPIVVQHSAGHLGAGGPVAALKRVVESGLSRRYEFVHMHQDTGNGAVDIGLLYKWAKFLRGLKPDIVHVRGLQNEGFHGVLAARLGGCKRILVTVHGTARDLMFDRNAVRQSVLVHGPESYSLRAATHLGTVCQYAANRPFIKKYSSKFVGVIPNGVTVPADRPTVRDGIRKALRIGPTDVVLIAVSRITFDKGLGVLAEACKVLDNKRIVVLVVGDGPNYREVRERFASAGECGIHFLGRRLDVDDLLCASDIFVLPSFHENLSNSLLEAMAHRLPAVATSVGGNIEVLENGGGILVPAGSAQSLAEAIDRLVADNQLRRDMGEVGFNTVRERYSVSAMTDSLDRVYSRILDYDV